MGVYLQSGQLLQKHCQRLQEGVEMFSKGLRVVSKFELVRFGIGRLFAKRTRGRKLVCLFIIHK